MKRAKKITIKKHTAKKRPVSRYVTYAIAGLSNLSFDLKPDSITSLVRDLSVGLADPLELVATGTNLSNMLIICKEGGEWNWNGSFMLENTEMYGEPKRWRMWVIKKMLRG
jgi:hypothetical protein